MNRLFDASVRRTGVGATDGFIPPMDVTVLKDHVLVKADLPGLRKEDVTVTLEDGYLTIRGEKKGETETKDAHSFHRERVFGSFTRSFEVPVAVDAKRIEATFKDGVLEVRLPKSEEAKPKQIEIKVS
jgi:HSP20 family protein